MATDSLLGPFELMGLAWLIVGLWVFIIIYTNRKHHPKALFYLFLVEMWERFSYYGMRALFMLYAVSEVSKGGLALDEASAYGVYAAYGALVYLTPIVGGYVADKVVGYRKAIVWGGLLMAFGQFSLMVTGDMAFLLGLALLAIGNGFFKPNISSLIGKLYPEKSPYRDSGFTLFYMGINVGAALTPLTCGTVGEEIGWAYGFGLAGLGMLLGLVILWVAQRNGVLEDKGLVPEGTKKSSIGLTYLVSILCIPVLFLLIKQNDIVDFILGVFGTIVLVGLFLSSLKYDLVQKQRIWVIIVLLLFTAIFFTFFELSGSALTLFTLKNVDKSFFGINLTTSNFQVFNPTFIMLLAPVFSWLWTKLSTSKHEPSAAVKFAIGIILLGLGFLSLNLSKGFAVDGMIPAMFLALLYLLHTLGELVLSPTGLSLVTKLSPAKLVGFMMGCWFLSSSIAHQAGKHIAKLTVVNSEGVTAVDTLGSFLTVFNYVGIVAVGSGILLLCLSPILTKWMHGIK